jgi:hypothetical protein
MTMGDKFAPHIVQPLGIYRASELVLNWDATRAEAPVELLQIGYQLAFFLASDRVTAIDILIRALEKVRVSSRREMKRLYWRDKHADRPVRRIVRKDLDMLQWLIMYEAERYERAQERVSGVAPELMVLRYIKHLVQLTTALSSFYVNVGITRLLHNYSTSETQRLYELLNSKYLGPDEYRRAKSVLMDRLIKRFPTFLNTVRTEHGEIRFATVEDPLSWAHLAHLCLQIFTPWSTQGRCLQFLNWNNASALGPRSDQTGIHQNDNELRSCHVLIEPSCYSRLTQELELEPPKTRLAIPRFAMPENHIKNDDGGFHPDTAGELSQEEMGEIQRRLARTSERRRNVTQRLVAVFIDGYEHARLELTEQTEIEVGIEAGINLIEIRAEDENGDLSLATHMVSYLDNQFESTTASVALEGGRLTLQVTPVAANGYKTPRAILALKYKPSFEFVRPKAIWHKMKSARRKLGRYAFVGLAMAFLGWGIASISYIHEIRSLKEALRTGQQDRPLSSTAEKAIVSYAITPDDQRVRGTEEAGVPEISLRPTAIILQLALQGIPRAQHYSVELKNFAGDQMLMVQNSLKPVRTERGEVLEIVVPTDLLLANAYYTAYLHSPGRLDRFSFKVILASK